MDNDRVVGTLLIVCGAGFALMASVLSGIARGSQQTPAVPASARQVNDWLAAKRWYRPLCALWGVVLILFGLHFLNVF